MKKIAVLLLLVLALAGCGKRTAMFVVDNQSDWRVVVSITNVTIHIVTLHSQTESFLKSMRAVYVN